MRFLVSRLRFLGDIILTTPLLDVLREEFPAARIEYLGLDPHVSVLEGHPSVDRLHRLPAKPSPMQTMRCVRELRSGEPIDWAFDLFSNPRSCFLVRACGARERVGSDRGARRRFYTHLRGRPEGDRSAVRHHLDKLVPLLGRTPAPRPTRLAAGAEASARVAEQLGLGSGREVIVAHPGSTWPAKAWPNERWPELLRWIQARTGARILVVQPPGEEEMARWVVGACEGCAELMPTLSIPELVALLARTRLYVGNDGGILHAAVAMRAPTVGLFGETEVDIWFPYTKLGPYEVLRSCAPEQVGVDGKQVSRLRDLALGDVQAAVERVLANSEGWT